MQTAWYVYPAADHTRFIHSLGTMELAGRFARAVYEPFHKYYQGKLNGERLPEVEHVVETFRIAGLLHDVGHGPMTHMLDSAFLKPVFGITHEDIAGEIIRRELRQIVEGIRRSPDGDFDDPLNVDVICNLVKKGAEQKLEGIWRPLHQIIRGAYDADKMDFLLRDGLLCGERKAALADVERLMLTSFMSADGTSLLLHHSSLPLLLSLIRLRQHMLEVVYYHRTVRAFELMVRETLPQILVHLVTENPLQNLAAYFEADDYRLLACMRGAKGALAENVSAIWRRVWQRDLEWKYIDEHKEQLYSIRETHTHFTGRELAARLQDATGLVHEQSFIVDSPSVETPGNVFSFSRDLSTRDRLAIYYDEKRTETKTVDQFVRAGLLPIKLLQFRLYARKGLHENDVARLRAAFAKETGREESVDSGLDTSY